MSAPMLARWLGAFVLCGALLPLPAGAAADAADWLERINDAASESNYRGTMMYWTRGGVFASSRVAHVCADGQYFERVESLDGNQHRIYRHDETVRTVWPRKQIVVVESRSAATGLPSTRRRVEPRALQVYRLEVLPGTRRVAGREARVLMLLPGDGLRFKQRLWADEATGLLLRSDVLGADDQMLESSRFSEVEIGVRSDLAALRAGSDPPGYKVVASGREPADWAHSGWSLARPVAGFDLVGCVRRPALQGGDGEAMQAVFSDGLSFVSIFVEPYDPARHAKPTTTHFGATHTRMQRRGDHWISVIGDVPAATIDAFARELQPSR